MLTVTLVIEPGNDTEKNSPATVNALSNVVVKLPATPGALVAVK